MALLSHLCPLPHHAQVCPVSLHSPLVRKLELLITLVIYPSSIPTTIYNTRVKTNDHYNNPSTCTFSHFRLSNCGVGEALYKVLHALMQRIVQTD